MDRRNGAIEEDQRQTVDEASETAALSAISNFMISFNTPGSGSWCTITTNKVMGSLSGSETPTAARANQPAIDTLMPVLYAELHRIAEACQARERPFHTLQPRTLLNEAYLRLANQHHLDWACRQIVGLAARMMRRILVHYAEARKAQKRGQGCRVTLDDRLADSRQVDIVCLDVALNRLEEIDECQARIVELRFFSGLSVEETATAMDLSPATVKREWKTARMWLVREIERTIR